ncbi:RNA-directed DNA polymerase, eukaryota, reverse transcriptase zinc-binding domain protein [Tanacetum coccineum]|uniref:RNA-directed DNA polymerase, eukaryota, reverse transcriptase zinc-binding domain protein n=1 Tax=Tanacetum coccineum TaxID=301880 RepID=A0ABQ5IZ27_9ASTR
MNSFDDVWIIFGDLNVVRCQDERVGSVFDTNEANSFNDFISCAGLFDFPLGGRRFTRFDKSGKKASKLDIFLASHNFFDCWNDASVSVLCRSFSDHCPIILKSFSSSLFRQLSSSDSAFLESVISLEEVKDAVWGCASLKASGPDGFKFKGAFVMGVWIRANRLAKVTASVISPNQSAFIEGRQILDGCLIANKIIKMASIEKLKLLLFKDDFKKAFDSVNWNFLLDIMRQMGFSSKWRNWIASCLSSASISILINGSPAKEFKLEKGL